MANATFCIRHFLYSLGICPSVRQGGISRILAVGLPPAGNGESPPNETAFCHFFEILFNAKIYMGSLNAIFRGSCYRR